MISFVLITSCNQNKDLESQTEMTLEEETTELTDRGQHPYGGWFCPDNVGGFPPVDIQDMDKVPVVIDRLPTKDETRNGTSLMYFDETELPDARPLKMTLPRVARIYSKHNDMKELIIVIQAVVVGKDTVVGYRYPNGGNGSAWFDEVTFLSPEQIDDLGATPFVYFNSDISASKEKIWQAITGTAHFSQLAKRFNKKSFFESDWTDQSSAHLNFESDSVKAVGIVTSLWGNLYIQIDYDYSGFHFSEKMLVIENEEKNNAQLHIVTGPYPDDIEAQTQVWENWLQEVKDLSETE